MVKFSVYLNRLVFVMDWKIVESNVKPKSNKQNYLLTHFLNVHFKTFIWSEYAEGYGCLGMPVEKTIYHKIHTYYASLQSVPKRVS